MQNTLKIRSFVIRYESKYRCNTLCDIAWITGTYLNLPSDWFSSCCLLVIQATEEIFDIPSISYLFNEAGKSNS